MPAPQPRHLQTPIRYAKHLEEEAVKPQIEFIGLGKKTFHFKCSFTVQTAAAHRASAQTVPFAIYTHTHTHKHTCAHMHKFNGI